MTTRREWSFPLPLFCWRPNDSDSKGKQVTSKRLPRNTAVNAAFALGPNRESTSSYNNGGLENSIRFLEDWGGVGGHSNTGVP